MGIYHCSGGQMAMLKGSKDTFPAEGFFLDL
jgi:hypothetical protein